MDWLTASLLRLNDLGVSGPIVFVGLYVIAAVTLVPSFLMTVAAGALFGVTRGSVVVFVGASLGACAAYTVAVKLSGTKMLSWLDREPRVAVVRRAVASEGAWVQFLLRLSPVVPFNLLNYALGLCRVRFKDFALALVGMIPATIMYTYYGRVVGDVASLAAGIAPPRGPEYYALRFIGLLATIVATTIITRSARRALEERHSEHLSG